MAKTIKGKGMRTQSNASWQHCIAPGGASHCLFIATLPFKVRPHCSALITNKLQFLCMCRLKANYLWESGAEKSERPLARGKKKEGKMKKKEWRAFPLFIGHRVRRITATFFLFSDALETRLKVKVLLFKMPK